MRDTGVVFDALTERQGQLRDLIANSNRVFETTAARDTELAETFRVLPTFLREGRATTRRLTRFAENTNPLTTQLRPAARQLSPLLVDAKALAPDLKGLFTDLGPLVRVSRRGLPATERVFANTRPLLARLDPFLRTLTPIVDYLGLYKREIAGFFANDVGVHPGDRHRLRRHRLAALPAHHQPDQPRDARRLSRPGSGRTARTPTRRPAATTSSRPRATSRSSATTSAAPTRCPRRPSRRRSCRPTWSS